MTRSEPLSVAVRRLAALAICIPAIVLSSPVWSQAYPSRPVRIVVPAAPGGGLDVMARFLSPKLSEYLAQPVVIENRPGAGFIVGTDAVAKAVPDGYTLLFVSTGALTVAPAAYPDLPYNVQRDLVPITLAGYNPFVLVVNAALPVNSVQEFIAYVRANPGKLNHATNSSATLILASELLKSLAKVDYTDINYKGAPQAVLSTVTGESHFCMIDYGSAIAAIRGGKVRAIAMTSPQRNRLQPNLPALADAVPGYASIAWIVALAPAKTSPEIVARLNTEIVRALAAPEITARFESIGAEVLGSSSEEAAQVLRADTEKWTRLVKERNIKVQ